MWNGVRFFGYVRVLGLHILSGYCLSELFTNRTQIIRNDALATGRTCIACGRAAPGRVGNYPVCPRHQMTVKARDHNWKWKNNVRTRHARHIHARACAWCRRRRGLTRHHDWSKGSFGHPPRPVVLCRRCHRIADSRSTWKVLVWRLQLAAHRLRQLLRSLSVFHLFKSPTISS